MNEIKVFTNEEFGNVRTVEVNGEPWLVGKDVAEALGYNNSRKALADHVDNEDKGVTKCDTLGGPQELTVINESGVYSLVFSSKLPRAKIFKHWVTSEVLPSIRNHGVYATGDFLQKSISDPEYAISILQELKKERDEKENLLEENAVQKQLIAELQPEATYCKIVLRCQDAIPITVIAKDYGWTPNQMNNFLRDHGVQYKRGKHWYLKDKYAKKGYTKSETTVYLKDGIEHSNIFMKWTQEGRLFIYNLMAANGVYPLVEREDLKMGDVQTKLFGGNDNG